MAEMRNFFSVFSRRAMNIGPLDTNPLSMKCLFVSQKQGEGGKI
jgi:hypothetical protein